MKNSIETIGSRTRDLLACSAVHQRTAPPRAPTIGTKERARKTWIRAVSAEGK